MKKSELKQLLKDYNITLTHEEFYKEVQIVSIEQLTNDLNSDFGILTYNVFEHLKEEMKNDKTLFFVLDRSMNFKNLTAFEVADIALKNVLNIDSMPLRYWVGLIDYFSKGLEAFKVEMKNNHKTQEREYNYWKVNI